MDAQYLVIDGGDLALAPEPSPRRCTSHVALDKLARRGCEHLRAALVLVGVRRRLGGWVVFGAHGDGADAVRGRWLVLEDAFGAEGVGYADLGCSGEVLTLSVCRDARAGVRFLISDADDDVQLVVAARQPTVACPGEVFDWLCFAAAQILAAESAGQRNRLRRGLEEREEERRRWARELHDETLQELGAVQVLLSSTLRRSDAGAASPALDAVRLASQLLSSQVTSLRHLITELRPAALDELGLRAPLQALARRTEALAGIPVRLRVELRYADGIVATRLLPDIEVAIYRVVQEAVTNACRHAGASRIEVSVVEDDTHVDVRVSDDGRGLDPAGASSGFGLVGMRERAELACGRLQVVTPEPPPGDGRGAAGQGVPRRGTTVRLVVPARHRLAPDNPAAGEPQT